MELRLDDEARSRDVKGRFLKGCNECKGKRKVFSENGMKSIMDNLKKAHKAVGRKWTNNGRKVVGVRDDGWVCMYPSASEAERRLELAHGVISNRCSGKTANRSLRGLKWFWESDGKWLDYVNELKDERNR